MAAERKGKCNSWHLDSLDRFQFFVDCTVNRLLAKVRQKTRWKINEGLFALGFGQNLLKSKGGKRMICYHGIDQFGRTDLNSRFLKMSEFEAQIQWLAQNCNLLSIEDYFNTQDNGPQLNVCLSFDDGYRNNFDYVLPILEEYEVPAIFYVTAAPLLNHKILWCDLFDILVDSEPELLIKWAKSKDLPLDFKLLHQNIRIAGNELIQKFVEDLSNEAAFFSDAKWNDYWQLMSENELKEIANNPLITIGGHSRLHGDLTHFSISEALTDSEQSKASLEKLIGKPVVDFAFPFGAYTQQLVDSMIGIGFQRFACLDLNENEDMIHPNCIGRMGNNPHISTKLQLVDFVRGSYI